MAEGVSALPDLLRSQSPLQARWLPVAFHLPQQLCLLGEGSPQAARIAFSGHPGEPEALGIHVPLKAALTNDSCLWPGQPRNGLQVSGSPGAPQ